MTDDLARIERLLLLRKASLCDQLFNMLQSVSSEKITTHLRREYNAILTLAEREVGDLPDE
jgi:hypothetical protein